MEQTQEDVTSPSPAANVQSSPQLPQSSKHRNRNGNRSKKSGNASNHDVILIDDGDDGRCLDLNSKKVQESQEKRDTSKEESSDLQGKVIVLEDEQSLSSIDKSCQDQPDSFHLTQAGNNTLCLQAEAVASSDVYNHCDVEDATPDVIIEATPETNEKCARVDTVSDKVTDLEAEPTKIVEADQSGVKEMELEKPEISAEKCDTVLDSNDHHPPPTSVTFVNHSQADNRAAAELQTQINSTSLMNESSDSTKSCDVQNVIMEDRQSSQVLKSALPLTSSTQSESHSADSSIVESNGGGDVSVSNEDESWDALYNDDGEALDPSLMDEV